MIFVSIDVSKDKHDCLILNSNGEVLVKPFTIPNNFEGFSQLYSKILLYSDNQGIKIGLEFTGHYSNNLSEFLFNKNLPIFIINPLHTSLYKKSQSLRKTKTDKVDVFSIASMLMTQKLSPYIPPSYHIKELKALTRYRFNLVNNCSKLKTSFSRLMVILFPELESIVNELQANSVYQLMSVFPSAKDISVAHITRLTNILKNNSKGHYRRDKAIEIRNAARNSIGTYDAIKSLELQQTLQHIRLLQKHISCIECKIKEIITLIDSPLVTIPGISYITAAMIHAEIGDFSTFSSAGKILAFAGMEPSIYQSGQYTSNHAKMVKRGSKYLRFALYTAAKNVSKWDPTFSCYMSKKRAEGKPYNVALSHVAKKLTRVIYSLELNHQPYKI